MRDDVLLVVSLLLICLTCQIRTSFFTYFRCFLKHLSILVIINKQH